MELEYFSNCKWVGLENCKLAVGGFAKKCIIIGNKIV